MEGGNHNNYHHHHVAFDAAKEMHSPRFRAIIRATSGRKRRLPIDVKSFSHELNSKGAQHYQFRKQRGLGFSEDIMAVMKLRFNRLKEDVNSELGIFAGDLVTLLEKCTSDQPKWRETIEDLLVVARECAEMSPDDFWLKCEGIVQNLDDRRQELPMGTLKQIHTRMLFILTRCTRLLQFQKEGAFAEDEHVLGLHQFSDLGVYPGQAGSGAINHKLRSLISAKDLIMKGRLIRKSSQQSESPASREKISSWKKLPSAAEKNLKKDHDVNDDAPPSQEMSGSLSLAHKTKTGQDEIAGRTNASKQPTKKSVTILDSSLKLKEYQQTPVDENSAMICRICDLKIPKVYAEDHSKICTIADRCDVKGLSVNERLERVAEVLEKILESCSPKSLDAAAITREVTRISASSVTEESDDLSPSQSNLSHPSPAETMDCFPEVVSSYIMNDLNMLSTVSCKTKSVPTSDPVSVASSPGSPTPLSSSSTPRNTNIDLLLTGRTAFSELENFQQIHNLLDIVRYIASINSNDYSSLDYLHSYLEDLQAVVQDKKVDALVVETFGRRIEKLLREKYAYLLQQIDDGNIDPTCMDEDGSSEIDTGRSSRTSPLCSKLKDRTSIEDFEIIKPISRGAFGRVFLAKKRVTGDLFAIKVLKKADMIRKNAVESILAERNILISVRNPFVVLALEYLHSLNVVHRDLKPDNLLIAHDGHIKLTDFGLSKVGLINSTDDLSGPDVSYSALLGDHEPEVVTTKQTQKREHRQKQSVVGTPDYLAPEILLGMTHGPTADWWSVGIILFELLVGIPPFNAEHLQKIFDNIMNRDITWPLVPEEMSLEARDLIDKLLIENPVQRLGATGAGEVKQHPFFKNINWDMLAEQKAAFIPSTEADDDTSYFACRHTWNSTSDHIQTIPNDVDDLDDSSSMSCCSSPLSYEQDEDEDEFSNLSGFGAANLSVRYSFSNFSFKNLSQLACMNYDLMMKSSNDSANTSNPTNPETLRR